MVDSIHTGEQILELNSKYPWTRCITWHHSENYYNNDGSEKSIKYSPNTYKLYPTGITGTHGRIYMALNSDLEITDEVIKENSLIIIRSSSGLKERMMRRRMRINKHTTISSDDDDVKADIKKEDKKNEVSAPTST